jgi:hypothetical protein
MRIAELMARYWDQHLGTTEESVITAAERLRVAEIATLDHRRFSVVGSTFGPLILMP